jgi:hypothetical protein
VYLGTPYAFNTISIAYKKKIYVKSIMQGFTFVYALYRLSFLRTKNTMQMNLSFPHALLCRNFLFYRFEAHMEVHVGSIDEEDDEQGIAHMIEHVAFLGSKKREKLLGTGARSNAYTDFHHTVFHIHSPISTKVSSFSSLCFHLLYNFYRH